MRDNPRHRLRRKVHNTENKGKKSIEIESNDYKKHGRSLKARVTITDQLQICNTEKTLGMSNWFRKVKRRNWNLVFSPFNGLPATGAFHLVGFGQARVAHGRRSPCARFRSCHRRERRREGESELVEGRKWVANKWRRERERERKRRESERERRGESVESAPGITWQTQRERSWGVDLDVMQVGIWSLKSWFYM